MSYPLILLGLLAERPRYGYDLKQTIEHRSFADYVPLSGGGLYYHLRKLCAEGYIEEQHVEREGNYPDRHIYRITAQGQAHFLALLRATLEDVEGRRHYDPLDAAFAFGGLLPPSEIIARLRRQIDQYRPKLATLHALHEIQSSLPQYIDLYSQLIVEHAIHRLAGAIRWLEAVIERVEATAESAPQRLLSGPAAKEELAREAGLPAELIDDLAAPHEVAFGRSAVHRYGQMRAAEADYNRATDDAWRMYEVALQRSSPDEEQSRTARRDYEERVAAAWAQYASVVEAAKSAALSEFAEMAEALRCAMEQAASEFKGKDQKDKGEGVKP